LSCTPVIVRDFCTKSANNSIEGGGGGFNYYYYLNARLPRRNDSLLRPSDLSNVPATEYYGRARTATLNRFGAKTKRALFIRNRGSVRPAYTYAAATYKRRLVAPVYR